MQPVAFREFRIFVGDGRPDRTLWAAGPWDEEEFDTAQWRDEATGLRCRVDRRPRGEWAGVVEAPEGPICETGFVECVHEEAECARRCPTVTCLENSLISRIDVHGLLAWSGLAPFVDTGRGIWCNGFHCGHEDNDLIPRLTFEHRRMRIPYPFGESAVYRTADYARAECARLARQIVALSLEVQGGKE